MGTHDIDINHDWINEVRQWYSDDDLKEANNFIQNALSKDRDRCDDEDFIDFQTLNEKQESVLKRIESHYNDILIGK